MIKLKNKYITAKIDERGAQLASLCEVENEKIWQKDKNIWNSHGPLLFPICGGLKGGKYTYNGTEYEMDKHGFAKDSEFDVKLLSKSSVTLSLKSSEKTKKIYPFDFELTAEFTLLKKSLIVKYAVKNLGDSEMYFSIGSHEAYTCAGGIENYDILFSRNETLDNALIVDGLLSGDKRRIIKSSKTLPLYEQYFENDSLVFKSMASRRIILRNRTTGERLMLQFPGADYFVIWHKKGAEYICLEPWAGLPDGEGSSGNIAEKEGIIRLKKGKQYTKMHRISILPAY